MHLTTPLLTGVGDVWHATCLLLPNGADVNNHGIALRQAAPRGSKLVSGRGPSMAATVGIAGQPSVCQTEQTLMRIAVNALLYALRLLGV